MTHLTAEQMQNYLVRRVSVDELGKLTEHLHGCRTCYGAYLTILQRRFPIEIDFEELGGLKGWHLQGQELADYVEGRMGELDFDYASLHLRECADCEQRVNDALRDWLEYTPATKRSAAAKRSAPWREYLPGFLSSTSPRARFAAAFVLIISFAVILWAVVGQKRQEPQMAITSGAEQPSPEPSPNGATPPKHADPGANSEPVRKTETVAKDRRASPAHPGNASRAEPETDIDSQLIARDLVMPAAIESFDKSPALAVRGNAAHVESFAVISPFSTLIRDEQPTFAWSTLTGATIYTVSVYDSKLRLVTTSQPLTDAHWSIPERLRRGAVYTWTVAAVRDGKEVIAPALPTRAEFKIIDKSELLRISRRIDGIVSHAARGVIFAEAGLLDNAEREFRTHLTLSPTDDRAKKLLETVESWRRLEPYRLALPTPAKQSQ